MQNKLQELTDKLYNEGLSKGRQEGEAIVNDAKVKAEEILAAARKEAEDIVARARKEADELKAKVDGDLKMAARESIAATRQDIEKLIVARMSEKETRSALTSASFVKEIITSVAKNFSPDAACVVMASHEYSAEGYVNDYNEYIRLKNGTDTL